MVVFTSRKTTLFLNSWGVSDSLPGLGNIVEGFGPLVLFFDYATQYADKVSTWRTYDHTIGVWSGHCQSNITISLHRWLTHTAHTEVLPLFPSSFTCDGRWRSTDPPVNKGNSKVCSSEPLKAQKLRHVLGIKTSKPNSCSLATLQWFICPFVFYGFVRGMLAWGGWDKQQPQVVVTSCSHRSVDHMPIKKLRGCLQNTPTQSTIQKQTSCWYSHSPTTHQKSEILQPHPIGRSKRRCCERIASGNPPALDLGIWILPQHVDWLHPTGGDWFHKLRMQLVCPQFLCFFADLDFGLKMSQKHLHFQPQAKQLTLKRPAKKNKATNICLH